MEDQKNIPGVNFQNRHQKAFEFSFVSNWEWLIDNAPREYDPFRPHRIHFYALFYVMKGEGLHYIDFKSYPYKKGSIIFISKDQVHAFQKNLERDAFLLLFTEQFLERSSMASNLMQQLSLYNYHLYPPVLQLTEKQMPIFSQLILRMGDEYNAPDDQLTEEIIQSALKILLCMAERIRKSNRADMPQSKYQEEFLQFQKLLNQHLLESRQVQYYADALSISSKKLNRITQDVMHQPAKAYINDLLIIEMKRLLMNTSLGIKEIAYKTGFDDPTNFVKYFKKLAGSTPVNFRRKF